MGAYFYKFYKNSEGKMCLMIYSSDDEMIYNKEIDFEPSEIKIRDIIKNNCHVEDFMLINKTNVPSIKIKYHNDNLTRINISDKGNFVDLRSSEQVEIKAGEFRMIDLGVSIKLPDGYWGQVVPRSSLFKNHGLIQTNSFGVIDTTYCGEEDHWKLPVYATRDTVVEFDERICQFRIVKDNDFYIEEVEMMTDTSRGGFGSTGRL